ncbi:MAG: HlyD family efflux transporter periplasmic adaptor subunit [Hyphomicrobiaceae bacterium]|nr:HlyD family efflux transporter periplasmic adaptor subunit [Hyphomicrobiaceae bacterium]
MHKATIATDLLARVSELPLKEGDRFAAGDLLVAFDCRRYEAEIAASDAQRREMELSLDNNLVLNQHRAIGKHEVEISRARVDKAAGEVAALKARANDCRILAPFSGRLASLDIHVHEIPVSGRPIIEILDDSAPEIELIVPSDWLRWLRTGDRFTFVVDELRRSFDAHVTRIGAAVDPISQTVKVFGAFGKDVATDGILSGMSGAAHFAANEG